MFSVLSVVTKTYCRCQDASGDDTHLQDKRWDTIPTVRLSDDKKIGTKNRVMCNSTSSQT